MENKDGVVDLDRTLWYFQKIKNGKFAKDQGIMKALKKKGHVKTEVVVGWAIFIYFTTIVQRNISKHESWNFHQK